jgi:DNA polymerase III alpha subunit (gram-positive type)
MKYENPLDIPLEKASFSVVDVETTGLSANKNRIIEIALVKIENLKITDKLNYLINPQTYIPPFITSLTGIDNDDVIGAPIFSNIVDEIISFNDNTFFAHNFLLIHLLEFMISGRLRMSILAALKRRKYISITKYPYLSCSIIG